MKYTHYLRIAGMSALFFLFFLSLTEHGEAAPKDTKIRVVDDTGYELILDAPASRIIGLDGALSELVLTLGQGHTLVGRTAADIQVEGLKHLPVVGTSMRPDPERIAALQTQAVLQSLDSKQTRALGLGLRKLGIPVLLFHLQSFEDINAVLLRLGTLTGSEDKAKTLVSSFTSRVGFLRILLLEEKRVPLFYELRYPHLLGAGGQSIITDIIHAAGGRNVVTSPENEARISEAELLRLNPTAYIIQRGPSNPDPKPLSERKGYAALEAVQQKHIAEVREIDFARPGPRAIQAAEDLARWLHPAVNFDISIPQADANMKKE